MNGESGIPTFGPASRPGGEPQAAKSSLAKPTLGKSSLAKPDSSLLRISDHDRQEFVDQLTRHCAEGRISFEELDERIAKAWEARTQADLQPLAADLPALAPATVKEPDLKTWLAEGKTMLRTMPSRALIAGAAGLFLVFLLLAMFAGPHLGYQGSGR